MSMEVASEILDMPELENKPEKEIRQELKSYERKLRKMLMIWEKGTTMRARNKWRQQLKEYKKRREEQRKIPHEVKKYYNYALKRPHRRQKNQKYSSITTKFWTQKRKYMNEKKNSWQNLWVREGKDGI